MVYSMKLAILFTKQEYYLKFKYTQLRLLKYKNLTRLQNLNLP